MIKSIVSALSEAIFNEFGSDYEIYTENVEQGLQEPCFFISSLSQNSKQFFSERYKKTNLFTIQYFPSTSEKKSECYEVAERLTQIVEWLNVGDDLLRGTNIQTENTNGFLTLTVNYNYFAVSKSKDDVDAMDEFGINANIKRND
jgi:hypothetical protein